MTDKEKKRRAEVFRQFALGLYAEGETTNIMAAKDLLRREADILDPPEPEKPLRWWVSPYALDTDHVIPGDWGLYYGTEEKAREQDGEWVPVCIHPADAPRCDVEGHEDLRRQANDFAVEVERLKRQLREREAKREALAYQVAALQIQATERDALLREADKEMDRAAATLREQARGASCGPCCLTPQADRFAALCSRVRAALAKP